MKVHELKDLAMIYHDADDYDVVVWDPVEQKTYDLIFTGSSKITKEINFNIRESAQSDKERKIINFRNELISLYREKNIIESRCSELKDSIKKLEEEEDNDGREDK